MTRTAAKVDTNQPAIVSALRQIGCSVQILSAVGDGCPDLLAGYHGKNILLECKSDKGTLTGHQLIWHHGWRGRVHIVRSTEEAIAAVNSEVRR